VDLGWNNFGSCNFHNGSCKNLCRSSFFFKKLAHDLGSLIWLIVRFYCNWNLLHSNVNDLWRFFFRKNLRPDSPNINTFFNVFFEHVMCSFYGYNLLFFTSHHSFAYLFIHFAHVSWGHCCGVWCTRFFRRFVNLCESCFFLLSCNGSFTITIHRLINSIKITGKRWRRWKWKDKQFFKLHISLNDFLSLCMLRHFVVYFFYFSRKISVEQCTIRISRKTHAWSANKQFEPANHFETNSRTILAWLVLCASRWKPNAHVLFFLLYSHGLPLLFYFNLADN
jgi:hypothetical protein